MIDWFDLNQMVMHHLSTIPRQWAGDSNLLRSFGFHIRRQGTLAVNSWQDIIHQNETGIWPGTITIGEWLINNKGVPGSSLWFDTPNSVTRFPGDSVVLSLILPKIHDMGQLPGLGRSPGGGNGNPIQYSGQGNPKDREAWQATVCGVTKSQTCLSTQQC